MAANPPAAEGPRPTLGLTGLTVNAMALIAPGAFLWTTFQAQSALANGSQSTASNMWFALIAFHSTGFTGFADGRFIQSCANTPISLPYGSLNQNPLSVSAFA